MPGSQRLTGPVGYRGSLETPATLRVGDMIESDGCTSRSATWSRDATPRRSCTSITESRCSPMGEIDMYRQVEQPVTVIFGEIVYTRR